MLSSHLIICCPISFCLQSFPALPPAFGLNLKRGFSPHPVPSLKVDGWSLTLCYWLREEGFEGEVLCFLVQLQP